MMRGAEELNITNRLNTINQEIQTISKAMSGGRKFEHTDGNNIKSVSLRKLVSQLKKLNREVEKLRPSLDSPNMEHYCETKREISSLAAKLDMRESQERKTKGFALKRFFGIPSKIRSLQLNAIRSNTDREFAKLQTKAVKEHDAIVDQHFEKRAQLNLYESRKQRCEACLDKIEHHLKPNAELRSDDLPDIINTIHSNSPINLQEFDHLSLSAIRKAQALLYTELSKNEVLISGKIEEIEALEIKSEQLSKNLHKFSGEARPTNPGRLKRQ